MKTELNCNTYIKMAAPVVEHLDIVLRVSTLDSDQEKMIQDACEDITFDLKNREVVIAIVEPTCSNFYNMLSNLLADTDVKMMIRKTKPLIDGDNIHYNHNPPNILFQAGKVTKHVSSNTIRENEVSKHTITFKFNKMDLKYDDVNYI